MWQNIVAELGCLMCQWHIKDERRREEAPSWKLFLLLCTNRDIYQIFFFEGSTKIWSQFIWQCHSPKMMQTRMTRMPPQGLHNYYLWSNRKCKATNSQMSMQLKETILAKKKLQKLKLLKLSWHILSIQLNYPSFFLIFET